MRGGLLTRVVLALAAVALIPLGLASWQLVRVNLEGMTTQVLRSHTIGARATAERIAALVSGLGRPLEAVAGNPLLSRDPRSPAAQALLTGLVAAQPTLGGVALVNREGELVVAAWPRSAAAALDALLTEDADQLPRMRRLGGSSWLELDVVLPGEVGWLRAVAEGSAVGALLHPEELGEEAELAVVDRSGEAVATAAAEGGLGTFPPPMLEAALSGRVGGSGRYPGDEGEVLGAYAPVAGTSWIVLSRQSAAVAEAVAHRMRGRAALALGLALLLAAAISAGAYRSLVRPLREVVAAQRRLAGLGEAGARGNEVEALRRSFETLERRVRDRQEVGDVFLGRYQVLELLGEGAMGSVFRGRDPRLERDVALKTVRLGATSSKIRDRMTSTLLREAVMVARFSHPNIVTVYDVEDTPEAAFVAMEYVEGVSLQQHLAAVRRLDLDGLVSVGSAIAAALAEAHKRGIVHHDVKPGNVLLGFDGSIKVADFGIARLVSAVVEASNQVFGTPGYLPPETLLGGGYDARGDLFALGVVLYQAACGRSPFYGRTLQEALSKTMRGAVVPLAEVRPDLCEALATLVMSLLEREREQRPESAAVVERELGALAAERGCRWRPPEPATAVTADEEVFDVSYASQVIPTTTLDPRRRPGRR